MSQPILSYCSQEVKVQSYAYYIAALFVPAEEREAHFTILAFHAEIARIPHVVSEPMLGHIRFAWWKEALEEVTAGKPPRKHPVVEALALLMQKHDSLNAQLHKIIELYRHQLESSEAAENADDVVIDALRNISLPLNSEKTPKWLRLYHAIAKGNILRNPTTGLQRLKCLWKAMRF